MNNLYNPDRPEEYAWGTLRNDHLAAYGERLAGATRRHVGADHSADYINGLRSALRLLADVAGVKP